MTDTRKEFEMTAADLKQLMEAGRPVPYMVMDGSEPASPQENANRAWCALGARMGFDGMTVEPSRKGDRFFTAIAKPIAASEQIQAAASSQAEATPDTTQIVSYHVTEESIRAELAKYSGLTADTTAGYEEVRLAIAFCRTTRTAIEKRRVELKASALEYGRRVDATAKHLTGLLEAVEEPLHAKKIEVDNEKARLKLEREAAERKAIEDQLRAERAAQEAVERAERERLEAIARADREAEVERQRVIREAEDARLREENLRLAAERERFAEEQRVAAEAARVDRERVEAAAQAERDAIARDREALAAQQRELEEQRAAAERAEAARVEKIRAEEEAKAQAERDRVAAEAERVAAAQREIDRIAREAEMRPDLAKLEAYALAVLSVPLPKLKTKEARAMLDEAHDNIGTACSPLVGNRASEAAE